MSDYKPEVTASGGRRGFDSTPLFYHILMDMKKPAEAGLVIYFYQMILWGYFL